MGEKARKAQETRENQGIAEEHAKRQNWRKARTGFVVGLTIQEQIRRQEENKMRRQQNEIKNAQIQVVGSFVSTYYAQIKNVGKLKKMSKKQLKQIKKTRIDKNGNVEYVDAYAK